MSNTNSDRVALAKIYQITRDQTTGKSTRKCLMNNDVDGQLNVSDCPIHNDNPYYTFIISTSPNKDKLIVSPFVGKCVGIAKDGKLVINIGCNVADSTLLHDDELKHLTLKFDQSCAGDETCNQYFIEEFHSARIWWNTNSLIRSASDISDQHINLKTEMDRSAIRDFIVGKSKYGNSGNLRVEGDKWVLQYDDRVIEDSVKRIWAGYPALGSFPGETVAWGGYNSNKRACLVIGPSGVGKSRSINNYAIYENLKKPIHISYDIPVEASPIYNDLVHLENFGFGINASDPTAYKVFYSLAGIIEEKIKSKAMSSNIDLVIEKADYPSIQELRFLEEKGYRVSLVFFLNLQYFKSLGYITDDQIGSAIEVERSNRFSITGRYGKQVNPFKPRELDRKIKEYKAAGFEDIQII